jgi:hypothetical protein
MAVIVNGSIRTPIMDGAERYVLQDGRTIHSLSAAVLFTVADTGASFSVSTTAVSWTTPTVGTLVGSPTYSNGQTLSPVYTNTNRTQSFVVTVPNDSSLWTNAGQNVTFSLSDIQEATAQTTFGLANTGAIFSVNQTTVFWGAPTLGTLTGTPTYANGQTLATVTSDTLRTQNFSVIVPNDPQYSNANATLSLSLSDIQELTVPVTPPVISGLTAIQDSGSETTAILSWNVNLQGFAQIGNTIITYNGTTASTSGTSITLTGLDVSTTETFSVEVTTSQGSDTETTSLFMKPIFTFADGFVSGSFAVNSNGVPSGTLQGGATSISFAPASYALSCNAISRSNTITFNSPVGYLNSTASGIVTATQPAYGVAASSGSLSLVSGSLTNIPSTGGSGTHSISISIPLGVGEWNVVYSGTGITPSSRTGCGDRTSVTWTVAANTGGARSGTIRLYGGSTQTTLLDTLSWNQLTGVTSYSTAYKKSTSESNSCNFIGTNYTLWSGFNRSPIANGDPVYTSSALTTSAPSGWYGDGDEVGFWSGTAWSSTGLCGF